MSTKKTLAAFRKSGERVSPGDVVTDFRGEDSIFVAATRAPQPGKTGKVSVEGEGFRQEFYQGVFDLEVREIA